MLGIDPLACLRQESIRVSLSALHAEDQALLRAKVEVIGAALVSDRAVAQQRYDEAEATARINPPPVNLPAGFEKAMTTLWPVPPQLQPPLRLTFAINQARLNASGDYSQKVRDRVSELNNVRWQEGMSQAR